MDESGPITTARRLLVVCVDDYKDSDASFTSGLAAQVDLVAGWLTDPSLAPEHRFSLHSPDRLKTPRDLREFMLAEDLTEAEYDEALVVYITGHGVKGESGRHYLTFGETHSSRLMATAFPTSELIGAVMDSEAEHVLVLVDSCFAGTLDVELRQMFRDLGAARRKLPTIAVVTSGRFDEKPYVGEFTEVVAHTLAKIADESAGYTDSHLSFEEWERLLKAVGEESQGLIEVLWVWPASRRHVPSACLPNPGYRPPQTAVGAAVADLALAGTPLGQYWMSRASGQAGEDDAGWYFSGRAGLMEEMIGFLREGTGALVVTGAAGSGKSALLARLVTLTDATFLSDLRVRDSLGTVPTHLRPPTGSVHAAVLARGKTAPALVNDLIAALGAEAATDVPPLQSLLNHLRTAARTAREPLTVVIDGLDEAEEPLACLSDLVLPMGRLQRRNGSPCVRLVLGMRSSLPSPSTDRGGQGLRDDAADQLLGTLFVMASADGAEREVPLTVLRTDGADSSRADIALYVRALLAGPEDSPYRDAPGTAAEAAHIVADAVQPSFLDARLAADQLRSGERVQDLADSAWQRRLQDGTAALLREDLRVVTAVDGIPGHLLLAVLRATAFAPGSGLPWAEVWPAAVRAVLGSSEDSSREVDEAIGVFRHSRLVGYLSSGQEDGRVTYRPVHQRITEALLDRPHSLLPDADAGAPEHSREEVADGLAPAEVVQRRLAVEFATLARASRPFPPHPYVRRHLVEHADAGGVLDDQHVPVEALVHETSATLRSRLGLPLPTGDATRRQLVAAALVEPYLDGTVTSASRQDSIAFHAAALGGAPVDLPSGAGASLRSRWAHWEARPNVLASPQGSAHALCTFTAPDGRALVAAGTRYGAEVWDIASGHGLARLNAGGVFDMCLIRGHSGRVFLVTLGPRRAAVWDPLSGLEVASLPLQQRVNGVGVLADGGERWRVVLTTATGAILWAPTEDWTEEVDSPTRLPLHVAAVRPAGDRPALVYADEAGLYLWDPRDSDRVRTFRHDLAQVRALVVLPHPGGDLVAVAHRDGRRVSLWDCTDRALVNIHGAEARRLAVMDRPGRSALLVTEVLGLVELWEPRDLMEQTARRDGGLLVGGIRAITTVPEQANRPPEEESLPRLVTASDEGIRLWATGERPLDSPRMSENPIGHAGTVHIHMAAVVAARGGLLAIGTPAGIDLYDTARGHRTDRIETGAATRALHTFPSPTSLVVASTGTYLQTWDLNDGLLKDSFRARGARMWASFLLPDGSPAILLPGREHLYVREVANGRIRSVQHALAGRMGSRPRAVVVFPPHQGGLVVAIGTDFGVDIVDITTGLHVQRLRLPRPVAVHTMALMPSAHHAGPLLAVATATEIHLWDTHDWTLQAALETPSTRVVAPVGNLLAYGNGNGVHLWDGLSDAPAHSLLTAAPVLNIATLPGEETVLYVSGPAGTAALALHPSSDTHLASRGGPVAR